MNPRCSWIPRLSNDASTLHVPGRSGKLPANENYSRIRSSQYSTHPGSSVGSATKFELTLAIAHRHGFPVTPPGGRQFMLARGGKKGQGFVAQKDFLVYSMELPMRSAPTGLQNDCSIISAYRGNIIVSRVTIMYQLARNRSQ